ncbi:hypothetical protein CF327_g7214 [Tilletia walkeri]|nr:hypothetical protein CF327_g7214 [Tilletia walkeri]
MEVLASLPIEVQHAVVSAETSAVRGRPDSEDVLRALEVVEGKLDSFVTGGAGAALGAAGDGEDDDFEVVASRRRGEAPQLSENGRDVIDEGARLTKSAGPEPHNNIPENDDGEQEGDNAQRTGSSVPGARGDTPEHVEKDGEEERGADQGGGATVETQGADIAAARRSSSAASNLSIWDMDRPRLEGGEEADASGDVGRAPEGRDDTPALHFDSDVD